MISAKSIIRDNAEVDPTYCPYCGRCRGLIRMRKVEPFYWRCACGAEHDERGRDTPKIPPTPMALCGFRFDGSPAIGEAVIPPSTLRIGRCGPWTTIPLRPVVLTGAAK